MTETSEKGGAFGFILDPQPGSDSGNGWAIVAFFLLIFGAERLWTELSSGEIFVALILAVFFGGVLLYMIYTFLAMGNWAFELLELRKRERMWERAWGRLSAYYPEEAESILLDETERMAKTDWP